MAKKKQPARRRSSMRKKRPTEATTPDSIRHLVIAEHTERIRRFVKLIRQLLTHGGEKGAAAENAVGDLLRTYLPRKMSLGSGFVLVGDNWVSQQCDIILHDEFLNCPVYSFGDSALHPSESVYGTVEVTMGKLTKAKLEEDINKCSGIRTAVRERGQHYVAMVIDEDDESMARPQVMRDMVPPRFYMVALDGESLPMATTIEEAATAANKGAPNAHIHGLLLLGDDESKYKLCRTVYQSTDVETVAEGIAAIDVFATLIINDCMSMAVGQWPGWRRSLTGVRVLPSFDFDPSASDLL